MVPGIEGVKYMFQGTQKPIGMVSNTEGVKHMYHGTL
jgi:hypothetical protein